MPAHNHTTRRYPRTLADAYPCERHVAMSGPYFRDSFFRRLARLIVLLACFAIIGAVIGWRF